MSTPLPLDKYCTAKGRLDISSGNGTTEVLPLSGNVILKPSVPVLLVATADPKPTTILTAPTVAVLDVNGDFTTAILGTDLVETDPTDFTYEASFDLNRNGVPVPYESFSFKAPAGGTIDITTVVHVAKSMGTANPAAPGTGTGAGPISVTALAPYPNDASGTASDTITISGTTGVLWTINGMPVDVGDHYVTGTVDVVATAASGYTLVGQSAWSFVFSDATTPPPPPPPALTPVSGHVDFNTAGGTFEVFDVTGVRYNKDQFTTLVPGVYNAVDYWDASHIVSVQVFANSGYVLQSGANYDTLSAQYA